MITSWPLQVRSILVGLIILAGLFLARTARAGEDEWSTSSLVGYEAQSIAFAPNNGDLIYLGTNRGLLQSRDGGVTWRHLFSGSRVSSVAVHPQEQEPDVLYSIAGEYLGYSDDQGQSWRLSGEGIIQNAVSVAIHPAQPDTVFVMGYGDVYRSLDGGGSWAAAGVPSTDTPLTFGFAPDDVDRLYAAFSDGIFRSVDGGNSWSLITSDLTSQYGRVQNMAVDITGRVFAWFNGQLLRSDDGGDSWNVLGDEDERLPFRQVRLRLDGNEANKVYLNDRTSIWRSDDGGNSWQFFENVLPGTPSVFALDPHREQALVAVVSGQLYRSADEGETWIPVTPAVNPHFVSAHPTRAGYLLSANSRDRGRIWRSEDDGLSWILSNSGLEERRVNAVAFDPHDENVFYAGTDGGLYRSEDGGQNWTAIGLPAEISVNAIAVSPQTGEHLYVGSRDGVLRSLNGGASWTAASFEREVLEIVVHPAAPDVVYARGRELYRSENGGETWTALETGYYDHQSLAVKPDDPAVAYLVADRNLFVTRDRGVTWQPVAGLPETGYSVNAFLVRSVAAQPELLLAAIDNTVFLRSDVADSWVALRSGAPGLAVRSLSIGPSQPLSLYVTFDGVGAAWQMSLSAIPQPATSTPTPTETPLPTDTPGPTETPTPNPTSMFRENTTPSAVSTVATPTSPAMAVAIDENSAGNGAEDEQSSSGTGNDSGAESDAEPDSNPTDDERAPVRDAPAVRPRSSWIPYMGLALIVVAAVSGLALWRLVRPANAPTACKQCGAILAPEAKFCIKCGARTGRE